MKKVMIPKKFLICTKQILGQRASIVTEKSDRIKIKFIHRVEEPRELDEGAV